MGRQASAAWSGHCCTHLGGPADCSMEQASALDEVSIRTRSFVQMQYFEAETKLSRKGFQKFHEGVCGRSCKPHVLGCISSDLALGA